MANFFIGAGEAPGQELISLTSDLEWFANQDATSGGEFGEPPPDNARIRKQFQLTGNLVFGGVVGDPSPVLLDQLEVVGNFTVGAVFDDPLIQATFDVVGGTRLAILFPGVISKTFDLQGTLSEIEFPTLPVDVLVDVLGHRPCFPLRIYIPDVTHLDTVSGLELYQAFLVSDRYVPAQGDSMSAFGAQPNAIGMRVLVDLLGTGVETQQTLFRMPREGEVVYVIPQPTEPNLQVLRWDGTAWREYRTMPQRALDEMRVFELLDPDGIWDYVATLFGLKYVQLQQDTRDLQDFIDPDRCPIENIPLLGDSLGAPVDAQAPEAEQRQIVRNWVPLMQRKGLPEAIPIALQFLGFSGYGTQVWARPSVPDGTQEAAEDFQERPFTYTNELPDSNDPDVYHPLPQVVIHLNQLNGEPFAAISMTDKLRVAAFLKEHVLPAHVRIRSFTTDHAVAADADLSAQDAGTAAFTDINIALVRVQASPASISIVASVSPNRGTMALQASSAQMSVEAVVIPAT